MAGDDIDESQWVNKEEHAAMEYAFEADSRIVDRYFDGNIERNTWQAQYIFFPFCMS